MIAAVVQRQELEWIRRIPNRLIEINHPIKHAAGANKRVHRLPLGFSSNRKVKSALEGRQSAPEDLQSLRVHLGDDLLIAGDDLVCGDISIGGTASAVRQLAEPNIIDAFQEDDEVHSSLRERITV